MKAVLDPNVLISAQLVAGGPPGRVFSLWIEGAFELVCSPQLLDELQRVLEYPKLKSRIHDEDRAQLLELLRGSALTIADPDSPPIQSSKDPDDDYLIVLAASTSAVLVSGDSDLLEMSGLIPVYSPREFLSLLEEGT